MHQVIKKRGRKEKRRLILPNLEISLTSYDPSSKNCSYFPLSIHNDSKLSDTSTGSPRFFTTESDKDESIWLTTNLRNDRGMETKTERFYDRAVTYKCFCNHRKVQTVS